MVLTERAEEILEALWVHNEDEGSYSISSAELDEEDRKSLEQLINAGYVTKEEDIIHLTDAGQPFARNVVRRHRLAERLLADVLGMGEQLMDEKACVFEHILDRGLDENICILLGHPKVCPHGKAIPPGDCCRRQQKQGQRVVFPLSQMNPGQSGKVAYIHAPEVDRLQKLTAMGILPGAPILLEQNFPSYVFNVRETQFAVDEEIAGSIFIRLVEPENNNDHEAVKPRQHRWRKGRLLARFGRNR